MARVDVLMPQMGESIAEGTLSKWLKKLGDEVKRDEPLFEISTDKVDAEIPAPNAGVLVEIKVQEGQTVPVQTLVAVIETDKGASAPAATSAAAQRAPAASGAAVASSPPALKPAPAPAAPSPDLPRPSPSSPVPPKGDGGVETAEERLRRKSTPLVRKIAAEHQVDISTIPGTGFAGRVTKQDILGVIERGAPAVPRACPASSHAPRSPFRVWSRCQPDAQPRSCGPGAWTCGAGAPRRSQRPRPPSGERGRTEKDGGGRGRVPPVPAPASELAATTRPQPPKQRAPAGLLRRWLRARRRPYRFRSPPRASARELSDLPAP